MCYPTERCTVVPSESRRGVFYHATDHGGGAPGIPRRKIVADILRDIPDADVQLYPGQAKGTRPSPEDYHKRMAQSLIGVSWNGAVNWDNNRFWENFAYGLAQVAERPRIQIPHEPIHGIDCLYVDTPEEVAPAVLWLHKNPEAALRIARNGHAHFLRRHSSEMRARYVLDAIRHVVS